MCEGQGEAWGENGMRSEHLFWVSASVWKATPRLLHRGARARA